MSSDRARNVGSIYIGLDFGMALTKVAASVLPPQQRNPIRVVIELPDSRHPAGRTPHIPSGLWRAGDRLYAFREAAYRQPAASPPVAAPRKSGLAGLGQMLMGFMRTDPGADAQSAASVHVQAEPIEGLKAALLDEWDGKPPRVFGAMDARPSELVAIKLALVLAHALRRLRQLADREAPNCVWRIHVNCAVPLAGARSQQERVQSMATLVERASRLAQGVTDPGLGMSIAEARQRIDERSTSPISDSVIGVHVTIESLAAALFHLQADGQTEGNWLTVDVGGLTTDTTLFFCNPEYRHVSYYSTKSIRCGTGPSAHESARQIGGTVSEAHVRLSSEATLPSNGEADSSATRAAVEGVMKQTAASALNTTTPRELFPTVSVTGRLQVRPNWRILLLGGGTVHPSVRSWIAEWKYGGPYDASADTVGIASCSFETCRLPANTRLLGLEGRLRAVDASTVSRTDQSILALAVGLAQPPWEIWEYSERGIRKETYGDDWSGDGNYIDK